MSIIVRVTKLGGGQDYVAGNDILAEEQNGDANTIYTDHNGNITDANCSAAMALLGSKLADSPNGISTAKVNDKAVTSAKIANDASVDANRAITADHVKDAAIIYRCLKVVTFTWTPGGTVAQNAVNSISTGYTPATAIPLMVTLEHTGAPTANHALLIHGVYLDTTANLYRIMYGNAANFSLDISGVTFTVYFISKA